MLFLNIRGNSYRDSYLRYLSGYLSEPDLVYNSYVPRPQASVDQVVDGRRSVGSLYQVSYKCRTREQAIITTIKYGYLKARPAVTSPISMMGPTDTIEMK